ERVAANPPRDDNADDKARGYNQETFYDDVIARSIVEVTQDGAAIDFDPLTEWEVLADEMTDAQYSKFAEAIFVLNRGEVSVPFSRSASRALPGSSERWPLPGSGASLVSGAAGGSRSPSMSMTRRAAWFVRFLSLSGMSRSGRGCWRWLSLRPGCVRCVSARCRCALRSLLSVM